MRQSDYTQDNCSNLQLAILLKTFDIRFDPEHVENLFIIASGPHNFIGLQLHDVFTIIKLLIYNWNNSTYIELVWLT